MASRRIIVQDTEDFTSSLRGKGIAGYIYLYTLIMGIPSPHWS